MKPFLTALLLSISAVPAMAQSVDMSSLFPTLTYPEPAPDTVTQEVVDTGN